MSAEETLYYTRSDVIQPQHRPHENCGAAIPPSSLPTPQSQLSGVSAGFYVIFSPTPAAHMARIRHGFLNGRDGDDDFL